MYVSCINFLGSRRFSHCYRVVIDVHEFNTGFGDLLGSGGFTVVQCAAVIRVHPPTGQIKVNIDCERETDHV